MSNITEKFLRYVGYDTQSAEETGTFPSSDKQLLLANQLAKELRAMGIEDAVVDEWGYVYGSIPATNGKDKPALGFIAHMDTSPAVSGADIKARVERNYAGGNILLNKEKSIVLSPEEYPSLLEHIGEDIVVTDGTTLLGADDKAGVAEIMQLAEYLTSHPEVKHCAIKIAFTPDEEVGSGADHFDVARFGADFGYTVDGGAVGGIDYENFNAASGKVEITGRSIHPGSAKGMMINALRVAFEFDSMLPVDEKPEYTEGYEGFYHIDRMDGNVEHARMDYIIRDHDADKFAAKKARFQAIGDYLNGRYGDGVVNITVKDSYYNMLEMIKPHMHLIDNAKAAMAACGAVPAIHPIRGGTDGSRLSYMGLPCPNLSTGGYNFHGRFEYISVQSMEKMAEILIELTELYSR